MIIKKSINIEDVKSIVTAVQSLQDAGEHENAMMVLKKLAGDILEDLK